MAFTKEEILKEETKDKEFLMNELDRTLGAAYKLIEKIKEYLEELGYGEANLIPPYIVISNKINEMSREFKKKDLSLYEYPDEVYGYIVNNQLGQGLILDVLNLSEPLVLKISNMVDELGVIAERLAKEGQTSKYNIFKRLSPSFLTLTEEEKKHLKDEINEYAKMVDDIYAYNYEDRVVPVTIKYFFDEEGIPKEYDTRLIMDIFDNQFVSMLTSLGLEDKIDICRSELEGLITSYEETRQIDDSGLEDDPDFEEFLRKFNEKQDELMRSMAELQEGMSEEPFEFDEEEAKKRN